MPIKKKQSSRSKWTTVIVILILLSIISFVSSLIIGLFINSNDPNTTGNVALIEVKGVILPDPGSSIFGSKVADASSITELIAKADNNNKIKAIIFEINSPGGSPVATYEISEAIKRTNKTTVAWIREVSLSGGYWVSSSCDYLVANPMSMVGSVGAIASYLDLSGFLENHSVKYQRLVAGKYKDIMSPLKEMSEEEEILMQKNLDKLQSFFLNSVAANRRLSKLEIDEISSAMIYLGIDAKKLRLVDKLGGKKESINYIENKHKIKVKLAKYKRQKSITEMLSSLLSEHSYSLGLGIGNSITSKNTNTASGISI